MHRGIAARPPTPSAERPTARVDCTHAADELGQVVRKYDRFAWVLVCRRSSGQPGLHRPWKRVTRSGFAECDRLGRQEPSASQQLAGCLGLGFEPPPRRCDVPRFYGTGLRGVRQCKARIHRPLRSDRLRVVLATRGTADLPARARSQERPAVGWDASAHREHSCFDL
jgi:hypothetical protein